MRTIDLTRVTTPTRMEHWPAPLRALLGVAAASVAVAITYSIGPLRAFPLLLAFPTVVLAAWFLGMWGGVACGVTDAILVDRFLTKAQAHFSLVSAREDIRLAVFLLVSLLLGYAIRRLAQQRAQLVTQELQQRLVIANAERQLAEEQARASEILRERDDLLQIALRTNGMGIWAWDLHHDTLHCSDELYRMYGIPPSSDDLTAADWINLIHADDRSSVAGLVAESRAAASELLLQYRIPWPDGSLHWIEARGRYQRDSQGLPTRIVGVSADITHRKHSDEAMLRAEKLAVAGRLAASIAHEINNPLEAVANLLFIIANAETLDASRTHAQQALDELMRISMITQQTLKFHRQPGAPRLTLLSDVVQTVLTLFRGRMRSAHIVAEVDAQREISVACMSNEIQQVFANLVSNAIDAMPGPGRLLIRLRPGFDWRDRHTLGMRITFCDSGTGMNHATRQRIFEPFFTTKPETGTGLGLWVVAQLVERHRGAVHLRSTQRTPTSGTAISIFLPTTPPQ